MPFKGLGVETLALSADSLLDFGLVVLPCSLDFIDCSSIVAVLTLEA